MHDENDTRFTLTDGQLLLRLMKCPGRGGQRHTVRSLAAATGISKSKISSMTRDEPTKPLTGVEASLMAQAVGVRRKAIFTPNASASADTDEER